jgi:hypothetical protein
MEDELRKIEKSKFDKMDDEVADINEEIEKGKEEERKL